MSASLSYTPSAFRPRAVPARLALSPVVGRTVLLVVCVAAVLAAAWVGEPARVVQADLALAQLMRGMALIKGAIALGAVALLLWRFGWPVGKPAGLAYVVSAALMAGATMLIWQLTFIPLAAALFHIGALAMLLVGWRDDGLTMDSRRCSSIFQ
jgi:uncharacterized membrane protein YecN with MAPEG domain